jgi:hypothetical protein
MRLYHVFHFGPSMGMGPAATRILLLFCARKCLCLSEWPSYIHHWSNGAGPERQRFKLDVSLAWIFLQVRALTSSFLTRVAYAPRTTWTTHGEILSGPVTATIGGGNMAAYLIALTSLEQSKRCQLQTHSFRALHRLIRETKSDLVHYLHSAIRA